MATPTTDTHLPHDHTVTPRRRRSAALVGNRLVLTGAVLYLCEFVGIIATHVHTMPTLPGSSSAEVARVYAGQLGAAGFLAGWYALVIPGRLLYAMGLRRALLDSTAAGRLSRTLLDWAVALMGIGVVIEVVSGSVLAGAATSSARGDDAVARGLDAVAHYLQVAIGCPSGMAALLLGVAMWLSGVFPRVLAGTVVVLGAVQSVSGALLSAPGTATIQDGLTVLNLAAFVTILWTAILVFVRTRT